jgi:hypothetical protein
MPKESKPRPSRLRLIFRWTRIVFLFAVFLVVAALSYLHLVGLPNFLKAELLDRLHDRGFELQFINARLGWWTEIIVDNASFHQDARPLAPRLAAARTQIRLNPARLLRGHVAVDSIAIGQGSLELPFSLAGGDRLAVNNVFLDIDLLAHDAIRLNNGRADFHGIQFTLHGAVTNYLTARKLNFWPAAARTNTAPAAPRVEDETLRRFAATLDQIHFSTPPKIALNLTVDARDYDTAQVNLDLDSSGAETPWGSFTGLKLRADCSRPIHPDDKPFVKLRASADSIQTPDLSATNLTLIADLLRTADTNLQVVVNFTTENPSARLSPNGSSNSITARQLHWDGKIKLQPAPFRLLGVSGELQADTVATPWAHLHSAEVVANAAVSPQFAAIDTGWEFWHRLDHWSLDWQADLSTVKTTNLTVERLRGGGSWRAPEFVLTNLEASLFDGKFSARARLDVATREVESSGQIDFELHRLAPLLPGSARSWLTNTTWVRPPKIAFAANAVLPPWTNHPPNWAASLLPSLRLAGDFSVGAASSRGFSVDSLQAHFACTNQLWQLSGLTLQRPDGQLSLDFTGGGAAPDYLLVIDSKIAPAAFRPLLPEAQRPFLDEAIFTNQPPQLHAEIRGRAGDFTSLAVSGNLAATNFVAHQEAFDELETGLAYSNSLIQLYNVHLVGNGGQLTADYIGADLGASLFSVSNALSTMDPHIVNRLMGEHTPVWLNLIGFDQPPTVHVEGSFSPVSDDFANLDFNVSGQTFRYNHLLADTAAGDVHWHGRHVALTNVQATLYHGTAAGNGVFDYDTGGSTRFRGHAAVGNVDLQSLVRSFSSERNPPEGNVNADATITDGSSSNRHSWVGTGHVAINHAQIWNIKVFGIFSPMLNAIIPGSGNSRAYQANADLLLTNALLATDNLEIRSTDFRLLYRGSVDMDKKLDARVEAKILRDTPLFGGVFSWALSPLSKLFEYKITGTLDAPISRPLYLPKALTVLTEPFHKKKPDPGTNSLPANGELPK